METTSEIRVPRVVRDGKVAVIYRNWPGMGWYDWHRNEELLYSPAIVEMIEQGAVAQEIFEYCIENGRYYDVDSVDVACFCYLGIRWIPESHKFCITEYEMKETIVLQSEEKWFTA